LIQQAAAATAAASTADSSSSDGCGGSSGSIAAVMPAVIHVTTWQLYTLSDDCCQGTNHTLGICLAELAAN
jgi:hypothetical protein